ncbi:toll/interleukin-1 receptor domain-containing protein [Anaeromyxobacter diazotrophicus]|uniref:TIR domain-containing protein n=1 Tax=Anaeromyxobacter diazotrophicus TaxID=2590199 RepID=A0A7I9VR02_9BACT|nr:TIR domain-containing protein [Anaeromyxobacter diazotrophicus]GEJ58844.1 hypothetical protein AMYX_35850 [Anaeromyxobacter diazotrophicus]
MAARSARKSQKSARPDTFEFDVALSFAGEDRHYVEKVARDLRTMGFKVFYDKYEQITLWGKDLYVHLSEIYSRRARYSVLFISRHYARKVWTNHERRAAQSRAFSESSETILPARFDATEIPGLLPTVGYVSLQNLPALELARMIRDKIGRFERAEFLPTLPDRVIEWLLAGDDPEHNGYLRAFRKFLHKEAEGNAETAVHLIEAAVRDAFAQLRLMREEERKALGLLLYHACPASLPRNLHIDLELLCRLTGLDERTLLGQFERLDCLGFNAKTAYHKTHSRKAVRKKYNVLELEFRPAKSELIGNWTMALDAIAYCIAKDFCSQHFLSSFVRLDFSSLSNATRLPERIDEHPTAKLEGASRAPRRPGKSREPREGGRRR